MKKDVMFSGNELELFNKIIEEQIQRVIHEQNLQFEISVLQDLKRMAELGCFTVYTASPNDYELKMNNENSFSVECYVPRMMWEGEIKMAKLIAENKMLKQRIKELES
jgi:hypothetical protein